MNSIRVWEKTLLSAHLLIKINALLNKEGYGDSRGVFVEGRGRRKIKGYNGEMNLKKSEKQGRKRKINGVRKMDKTK